LDQFERIVLPELKMEATFHILPLMDQYLRCFKEVQKSMECALIMPNITKGIKSSQKALYGLMKGLYKEDEEEEEEEEEEEQQHQQQQDIPSVIVSNDPKYPDVVDVRVLEESKASTSLPPSPPSLLPQPQPQPPPPPPPPPQPQPQPQQPAPQQNQGSKPKKERKKRKSKKDLVPLLVLKKIKQQDIPPPL
jgi:hypothetical protein